MANQNSNPVCMTTNRGSLLCRIPIGEATKHIYTHGGKYAPAKHEKESAHGSAITSTEWDFLTQYAGASLRNMTAAEVDNALAAIEERKAFLKLPRQVRMQHKPATQQKLVVTSKAQAQKPATKKQNRPFRQPKDAPDQVILESHLRRLQSELKPNNPFADLLKGVKVA